MPTVRVIDRDGNLHELDAPNDVPLMEPLRDMEVGVSALCGGMCECATCHVYVDHEWLAKLPAPRSNEGGMLGDLSSRRDNSRLSCQLIVRDSFSGLKITLAPEE